MDHAELHPAVHLNGRGDGRGRCAPQAARAAGKFMAMLYAEGFFWMCRQLHTITV